MTSNFKPAPVVKSVWVRAQPQKAFDVFTADFGRWWPSSHSVGASPIRQAILEPVTGGRWYEIGEDGAECDWGEVLAFEPPSRLLLAWRLGADWKYHAELLTEVEVRFTAEGDGTRVDLEHRRLENMGDGADMARGALDSEGGWSGLLALYAGAAESS